MEDNITISEIQNQLTAKEATCHQIVLDFLKKIKQNLHLNAFLEVYEKEALDKALLIDEKFASGKAGKLAGLIIGIKDNISHKNHNLSASSKILEGFSSVYNSTVVDRLLKEDAIIIGRLNCDEFAMGSSNENSAYGNVLNPNDEERIPGGSSGGAAAAVRAGLCHAALGTDTGGSIRQPASLCGVVGLKPTYGRVSRHGCIAYASSFDQIGPITNSVEDAALILEVISGMDEFDATLSSKPVPSYSSLLDNEKCQKIAIIKECIEHPGLDKEIHDYILNLIEELKANGHTIQEVSFPYMDYVVPAYYVLTTAEASSNLARYDGIHYGFRSQEANDLESTYRKSRTEGFGKEVKRRIMLGTFVLSAGYYDAYFSKAQKVRRMIKEKTENILNEYDQILIPTSPGTAPKIGEKIDDPIAMYLEDIFTVQANLTGFPAISLPIGMHSNGLPFGIQLIGKPFDELKLLQNAKTLMQFKEASI